MAFSIVRSKEKAHQQEKAQQQLDKKWILLILIVYILSLFLPSGTLFTTARPSPFPEFLLPGAEFLIVGATFFWLLPISLPFYANILFFIVLTRLALGKLVRFFLAEITILLMLSSQIVPMEFAWGYVVWLISGCLLWTAYRVTQKGAKPTLWLKTVVVSALMCMAAWQLGEYQRRQYEIANKSAFTNDNVLFASPMLFFNKISSDDN